MMLDYSLNQHSETVDDARQRASRLDYGVAYNNGGRGLDTYAMTSQMETGQPDLLVGSHQIAIDTPFNGVSSKSYGFIGINSATGSASRFAGMFPEFGLTAKPGSAEFDRQWMNAVRSRPEEMVEAQIQYHRESVAGPSRNLAEKHLPHLANDGRLISFIEDARVQMGGFANPHIEKAKNATTVEEAIDIMSRSMIDNIGNDFNKYLKKYPDRRQGLVNRVNRRREMALGSVTGALDDLGVPIYRGKVPDIRKDPEFRAEMEFINGQIDDLPMSNAKKAQLKRSAEKLMVESAIGSLVQRDPSAALAALRSGQLDSSLDFDFTSRLEGDLVDGERRQVEQQAKAARSLMEKQIAAASKQREAEFKDAAFEAYKNFVANPLGQPRPTDEMMGMLTREQRFKVATAEAKAVAEDLVRTSSVEDLPSVMGSLFQSSNEGGAIETAALNHVEPIANEIFNQAHINSQIDQARSDGLRQNTEDPDIRRALNERFQDVMNAEGATMQDAQDFITQYRYVPDQFERSVAQALGGTNQEAKIAALESVGRIDAYDPSILSDAGKPIKRALGMESLMADVGLTFEEAQRIIDEPVNENLRNARFAEWNDLSEEAWELFQSEMLKKPGADGGVFRKDAILPSTIWHEYEDAVRQEYARTGHLESAVRLGTNAFYRLHGISYVGGVPTWERQPANKHFSVYGDPERDDVWIKEQAQDFIKSSGEAGEVYRIQSPDNASRSDSPEYIIHYLDRDGVPQLLAGFQPDRDAQMSIVQDKQSADTETRNKANHYEALQARLQNAQAERANIAISLGERLVGGNAPTEIDLQRQRDANRMVKEAEKELREFRDEEAKERRKTRFPRRGDQTIRQVKPKGLGGMQRGG